VSIVSNAATADFFYSNDLKVLIDIIVRESEDLPAGSKLQYQYFELAYAILRHSPWRTKGRRYREEDVVHMLNIAADAPEESDVRHCCALPSNCMNSCDP